MGKINCACCVYFTDTSNDYLDVPTAKDCTSAEKHGCSRGRRNFRLVDRFDDCGYFEFDEGRCALDKLLGSL